MEFELAVGDSRREAVGRAVFGTVWLALAFFVFTAPTKQLAVLYDHAPWLNDPFDTVYSFAMFFVPLTTGCFLVQVSLCLKTQPLPLVRVRLILRTCRVAVAAVAATLVSCWLSVATAANHAQWTVVPTSALIAALALVSVLAVRVAVQLLRAPRFTDACKEVRTAPDWLADTITAARRESRWLGPARPLALAAVARFEELVVLRLRRHPLLGAAVAAAIFGLAVGINQGLREDYALSATLLTVALLIAGMFAFLVIASSYLGLVRSEMPSHGLRRRGVDALVAACIAGVCALAFRDSLWWLVGSRGAVAGATQFAELLALTASAVFVIVLAVESLLRAHRVASA
jgi:hypothetical protein